MSKEHILIVDDEENIRKSLQMVLDYEGFRVTTAGDGAACLAALATSSPPIDLVLLDIKMKGKDGLQVLGEIKAGEHADLEVVMISGHADIQTAIQATRSGAFDLVQKPLDTDRLLVVIRNALEKSRLARENRRLASGAHQILGETPVMVELRAAIEKAARSQARVFITGENGSGKELIARGIHVGSPRASRPFVEVNCAAIPKELIESVLFGHVKGAFTGADESRSGKFEQASGGTLFLDEIGDMPLEAQAKVLRVLEEQKVERVGGSEPIEVDVRVVAATNRDVEEMIAAGEFREDLYYRLCVIPLHSPPLRERREDIPLLANEFLALMCDRNNVGPRQLSADALAELSRQAWPGNVRQLRNVMERIAIMAPSEKVTAADLARFLRAPAASGDSFEELFASVDRFEDFQQEAEKRYLSYHLAKNDWNIKHTAEVLGMQRSNLYKKIEKHGLR